MSGFICGTGRSAPKADNAPIKKTIGPSNPNAREWDTSEVLEWLQKIEKQEYRSDFQRHNINGKKLLALNSDDLKQKLGIIDTGDRKKIKKEIAKLKNNENDNNNNNNSKINKQKSNVSSHSQPLDNNNNSNINNINNNNNNNENGLSKSQSAYLNINGNNNNNNNGMNGNGPHVEFSNQLPYGRGGFDSDLYINDKKQDKQLYFQTWQIIVGPNSDILLQTQYNNIMKGSKLTQQDQTLIWQLSTHYNQGRCTFEQFADIIKITFIALTGVPLYLINTQKLIWFHPPLPSFIQNYQPNNGPDMFWDQVKKNTVAFRGIPPSILESDERLMKFAELALHTYEPVHFEINESTLIATFRATITHNDLNNLRAASAQVIQQHFGIGHINGRNLLMALDVDFPNALELGLTPGGGGQPPSMPLPNNPNDMYNNNNNYKNGGPRTIQPNPNDMYNNNSSMHNMTQSPMNGSVNGYHNNNVINNNNNNMPPPQYDHGHGYPQGQLHSNPNTIQSNTHDPYHMNQPQMNGGGRALPPPPGPPNVIVHSAPNAMPQQQPNYNQNGYGPIGRNQQQPPMQHQQPPHQQNMQQHTPDITPRAMSHAKKQEFIDVLLSENFWEEFRNRSKIDQVIPNDDTKIRTKAAMSLIASLREVPLRTINYLDKGVKELQLQTKGQLRNEMNNWTMMRLALLLDIPENEIPEVYKGIIIEGLPDAITADDDTIRKLDSEVLYMFIVSHIEVVDNVLRITFKKDVSQGDIDKLRRGLKMFLKDVMKLDKKLMKNVSLIPHTRDTWRDQTTTSEYDDVDMPQYGNEV